MCAFSKELEFLEAFLITEHSATVIFGKDEIDAYYPSANCIGINSNHSKEIQLFCLLHEAGHLIIRSGKDFSAIYPDSTECPETQISKVDTIREEIDAWSRGKELAESLGIKIDEQKWNRYWKQQVFKYIKWAAKN